MIEERYIIHRPSRKEEEQWGQLSQERIFARAVAILVIFLAIAISLGFGLLSLGPKPLSEPDPRILIPREMPLETMEMNFDTIHTAIRSSEIFSVNNPKGIIIDSDMVIKPGSSTEVYDRLIPPEKAAATADRYPHLFSYNPKSREFKFKATYPGKHYVVVPAWMVATMIDNNVLKLN